MNKKFSTLLCAGLLAFSGSTAFAANDLDGMTSIQGADASKTPYLESAQPKGLYQLRARNRQVASTFAADNDSVLVVLNNKYYLVKAGAVDVRSTLWCANLAIENQGKEPIYDFINKSAQAPLAYNEKGTNAVGQAFNGWAFSPSWTKKDPLQAEMPMYTYINSEEIMVLKKTAADEDVTVGTTTVKGRPVQTVVLPASSVLGFRTNKTDSIKADYVYLTLTNAGTYVLNVNEVNAYLKDNSYKFKFNPDANADVNPFSSEQLVAEHLKNTVDTDHNFMFIKKKGTKTYLKVDTAANGVGIEFLKFGWSDTTKEAYAKAVDESAEPTTTLDAKGQTCGNYLVNQHKFLFTYRPSADSLFIQVKQARVRDDKKAADKKGFWREATVVDYDDDKTTLAEDAEYHDITCEAVDAGADSLFVKLQNFTVADRIATIGMKSINTHIGFDIKGCAASNNLTSLDEGLYIIKNAKGQVLAAPIHLNDNNGTNEAQWVTLDEQEPLHMPAYQWVVVKANLNDKAKATSAVSFTNREFPVLATANVQLALNEKKNDYVGSMTITGPNSYSFPVELKGVTFTKITDPKILTDKKLGYRFIPSDSLRVNKYVFNYLNPFTDEYWMANGEGKDSVNYVKKNAARYNLVEGSTAQYGFAASKKVMERLGFVVLERTGYVIRTADAKKALVEAYNEKYSMGVHNYGFNKAAQAPVFAVDTFFFKENNHWNAKHFYAIVEATSVWKSLGADKNVYVRTVNADGTFHFEAISGGTLPFGFNTVKADGSDVIGANVWKYEGHILMNAKNEASFADATHKVGTADDGKSAVLKVQLLNETRTSAFTVEPDEIPLYRRFNNTNLNESKTDAHDSLIFVEKIRKEYLMDEWNPNLLDTTKTGTDYAGIWNKETAKGKLVFNIDTTWVNRGLGYIKPQYLISAYQQVIDQDVVVKPCEEGTPHVDKDGNITTDPSQCIHAKREHRKYIYGKFLVNFADSARLKADKPYMDIANGYTRVGFVKAIKYGDTLVVLTNGFENKKVAELDTTEIFKTYKALGKMDRVIDLRGDAHKNVTWSFRYVTPSREARTAEAEGQVNEFLFESNIYEATGAATTPGANVNMTNGTKRMDGSIAPSVAAWLKMQNGCLVLTRGDSKFNEAKTGADGALIFNVERPSKDDQFVTDNEEVAVEGVQVVAGNGVVTVQGAAGETVTVTNILGQTLAQQVLTSDNATIAVPAGVVVVKVAGEATKVVVK